MPQPLEAEWCCEMRRHFLIGIVGHRSDQPTPTQFADFVVDWDTTPVTIAIHFCPFCGETIDTTQSLRVS